MRVTGSRLIDVNAAATLGNQAKVATAAAEVSSGVRVTKPSDDPTAWLSARRASVQKTLTEGASESLRAGRERLTDTDTALAAIGEAVSRARELVVQGSSATYNASNRAALALEVRALFEVALGAANTRSADGEYVLAGSASMTAPFSATGAYVGDAAARSLPTAERGSPSGMVAGSELTATAGVDVLPLLDQVATALANDDLASLQTLLGDLQTAVSQTSLARTRVGSAMVVLDGTLSAHAELGDHLASEISRAVESDGITAASSLAKASHALEASLTVTSHVLNLVNPRSR